MCFTEGSRSPFFVYFLFSILCATLRWQWRGTLWTAVGGLAAFIGLGVYAAVFQHRLGLPAKKLHRLERLYDSRRCSAGLLRDLPRAASKRNLHAGGLAARCLRLKPAPWCGACWSTPRGILHAPRILMVWDEKEEPGFTWRYGPLASSSGHTSHPARFSRWWPSRWLTATFYARISMLQCPGCFVHPPLASNTGRVRRCTLICSSGLSSRPSFP